MYVGDENPDDDSRDRIILRANSLAVSSSSMGHQSVILRHLEPDRTASTDSSPINVFWIFLLFLFFLPPLRFALPFRSELTPPALLAGIQLGLSPLCRPLVPVNPGMWNGHYLDSTLSFNLSRTRTTLHSMMSKQSRLRARKDAPGYVGW
ncbi:hypothetical protein BDV29DRAFT_177194 [Aspergillus leporis]|jgi:hypothetical protein|uniref:Uncharacterized protein n=1 Tax=Aspergillus leporis TaxID=41062 RepID=A0A5N5WZ67_9EURO|nr:hypothetical protein BDV29DRAFT_177194 [Aspergillus leporis]